MTPRERLVIGGPGTDGRRGRAAAARRAGREAAPGGRGRPPGRSDHAARPAPARRAPGGHQGRPRPAARWARRSACAATSSSARGHSQAAGADVLVLDIAHGHTEHALCALGARCARPWATRPRSWPATSRRPRARATWSRRARTGSRWAWAPDRSAPRASSPGVGVPQLTAVMECAEACAPHDVPVIADGGIRAGGDVAKAIAAGAETVMVGNLLAGTPESPGDVVSRNGARVKVFRGMASQAAAAARGRAEGGRHRVHPGRARGGRGGGAPARRGAGRPARPGGRPAVGHELLGRPYDPGVPPQRPLRADHAGRPARELSRTT